MRLLLTLGSREGGGAGWALALTVNAPFIGGLLRDGQGSRLLPPTDPFPEATAPSRSRGPETKH